MRTDEQSDTFQRVYATYADMLYRLSLSILRSSADAEDAVQNAFCRYLDRAPDFRDSEHEKAWLLRVTINQCKNLTSARSPRYFLSLPPP